MGNKELVHVPRGEAHHKNPFPPKSYPVPSGDTQRRTFDMASSRQVAKIGNKELVHVPRGEGPDTSPFPPKYYHDTEVSKDMMWLDINHWQEMLVGEYLVSSELVAEFEKLYDEGDCRRFTELLVRDCNPLKAIEHMIKVADYGGHKDMYGKMSENDPGRWRIVTYARTFSSKSRMCEKLYFKGVTRDVCSGTAPQQAEWDFMNGYADSAWKDKKGVPHSKRRREAALVVDKAPTQENWDKMTGGAYRPLHSHGKGRSKSNFAKALSKAALADFEPYFEGVSISDPDHSDRSLSSKPQAYRSASPARGDHYGQGLDHDYPDEVTLRVNEKGEIVIGDYAISRELRMGFMEAYKQHDCRRLAFLSAETTTGATFARKVDQVAGFGGRMRQFAIGENHPDQGYTRTIRVGYDKKRGRYSYDHEELRSHVHQEPAPNPEHHQNSKYDRTHGHAQRHASSRHHTRHKKQGKA